LEVHISLYVSKGQRCGIFMYFEEKSVGKSEGFPRDLSDSEANLDMQGRYIFKIVSTF